jgi:hypothetical protein
MVAVVNLSPANHKAVCSVGVDRQRAFQGAVSWDFSQKMIELCEQRPIFWAGSPRGERKKLVSLWYDGRKKAQNVPNKVKLKRNYDTGKSLMSLGNIAAGSLLFGQAFSGFAFDFRIAVLGLVVLAWLYAMAWVLMRGGDES